MTETADSQGRPINPFTPGYSAVYLERDIAMAEAASGQTLPPDATVVDAKFIFERAVKASRVDELAAAARSRGLGNPDPLKAQVYVIKAARAQAGDLAALQPEADVRGVSVEELAARILAKAQEAADLAEAIEVHAARLKTAVAASSDLATLAMVDVESGWPV